MSETPQIVLITGATSGIGRHAAIYLADRGFRVIATGRNERALEVLRREKTARPLETLRLDVTDPRSIEDAVLAVDEMTDGHGIDALVSNAGYGAIGPLEMVSDADLRAQLDVNVFGLMAVTRGFVGAMRERGKGRIVNVSSIGGRFAVPMFGAYNASKFAIEAMSDALRMELAPFGVRVAIIEPGPIRTSFGDRAMREASKHSDPSSPYAPFMARAEKIKELSDKSAIGPEAVSRAIYQAIVARRPRARYVVPLRVGFAVGFLQRLPTRWSDAIVSRALGLTRRRLRGAAHPELASSERHPRIRRP